MSQPSIILMIFHRDLRLHDNTALLIAAKNKLPILPIFIIDPTQVKKSNNYRSDNALQFMIASLEDLAQQLQQQGGKLYRLHGAPSTVLKKLLENFSVQAVVSHADYTPFAQQRDQELEKICKKFDVAWHNCADVLLHSPQHVLKANGQPYTIFTPYYRKALQLPVHTPQKIPSCVWYTGKIPAELLLQDTAWYPPHNATIQVQGGRTEALKILRTLKTFISYSTTRNLPIHHTTLLSAYLKFGCVSPREVWHALYDELGSHAEPLVRQLYWRDFFTQVAYHFPRVFGHAFHQQYDAISWQQDSQKFKRWCTGTTGFPLIDAGMRQLNTTGWMHNRVRMIVASFLVKDLHLDWRLGERYFAQQLVDYDPAVNNGNWQWAASTGCDAQPYFRIFNPWLQQKKFDPQAEYIQQWVPELKQFTAQEIHNWHKTWQHHPDIYYEPMVDHAQAADYAKKLFTNIKKIKKL